MKYANSLRSKFARSYLRPIFDSEDAKYIFCIGITIFPYLIRENMELKIGFEI